MTLIEIFSIIVIHWVADFIFQDEKWALGKSKNWKDLLLHTITYSLVFSFLILMLRGYVLVGPSIDNLWFIIKFFFITFVFHTATDYLTSRAVSKRFSLESPFSLVLDGDYFKNGDIITAGNSEKIIVMNDPIKRSNNTYKVKLYNSLPNFGAFTIIGADQVLHYIQLFLTYYYLTNN